MTSSFFHRWDHWWRAQVPPHALAIFRIGFGFFLLIEALSYVPAVPFLFSDRGLVFSEWAHSFPLSLSILLLPPHVAVAWTIFCVYMFCCVLLASGCLMRAALFLLIVLDLYYYQLSFDLFPSSYHRLFFFTLVVLLFSGADRTFSFRMRRLHGSFFAWEPINVLPQRILAVQITATYVGVMWQKMWLPDWQNGEILYFSFIGKWGSPLAFWLARHLPHWIYDPLNWIVRITEFFIPVGLWLRDWRFYAIIAGTLFHLSITLLLGIWWFLVLPPAYVIFFDPQEVHRWLHRRFPEYIRP